MGEGAVMGKERECSHEVSLTDRTRRHGTHEWHSRLRGNSRAVVKEQRLYQLSYPLGIAAFGQIDGDDVAVDVDAVYAASLKQQAGQAVGRGVFRSIRDCGIVKMPHARDGAISLKPHHTPLRSTPLHDCNRLSHPCQLTQIWLKSLSIPQLSVPTLLPSSVSEPRAWMCKIQVAAQHGAAGHARVVADCSTCVNHRPS